MKNSSQISPPRGRDCYVANGREFIGLCKSNTNENISYLMVHGVVKNSLDGKPMGHAWIEQTLTMDGKDYTVVIDVANNRVNRLTIETYYYIGSVDVDKLEKFNYLDFAKKLNESAHWGRWNTNVDR